MRDRVALERADEDEDAERLDEHGRAGKHGGDKQTAERGRVVMAHDGVEGHQHRHEHQVVGHEDAARPQAERGEQEEGCRNKRRVV